MKLILEPYSKELIKKAAAIKAIVLDVDGVLTDGRIIYDDAGRETKNFHVKDGLIVSHLKKAGLITGAISGRESAATARFCADLKLDFCHQGILDKASVFEKLMRHYKLKPKEACYIGDDLNDLATFRLAGLSVCPGNAFVYIKQQVHLVTKAKAGRGVLREVADLILAARGDMEKLVLG